MTADSEIISENTKTHTALSWRNSANRTRCRPRRANYAKLRATRRSTLIDAV